jgi:outer membrane receptor protein involved in Fe transport
MEGRMRRWTDVGLGTMSALLLGWPAAASAVEAMSSTEEISVTAQRLTEARSGIQTQIGASTYTVDSAAIDAMPGGENNALNQVVLQTPGAVQDSFGQLHIRGEHNGLQYRLNGIILPEGISVFGQTLNPRLADQVELITGALPAEYGLRTAGIIDITTKAGGFDQGGEVGIYGGSHGLIQPSLEYGGSAGSINYFVSGSYQQNGLGIESPDGRSDPLHDRTQQGEGFGYFEDIIDPSSKISVILGDSREQFQIPDVAGNAPSLGLNVNGQSSFASASLNENQRETTDYGVLSYLRHEQSVDFQVSLFGRYSSLYYTPDPLGDLLFNGIAQTAYKRDIAAGVQSEGDYHLNDAHTLRAGIIVESDRGTSETVSQVLPLSPTTGLQTSDQPISITDDSGKTAWTYSVYLQDEWKLLPNLTLNYGGRFDVVDAYDHENQASPRANLVWLPVPDTTFHAGYARYLTPPPFELVGSESVTKFLNTTGAPEVAADTTPRSEKADYFDVGVQQKLDGGFSIGLDTYYKRSRNLIDEGQFGAPIIETPFNYASGKQYGAELTGAYSQGPFSAYGNFAALVAEGKDITSSQFNFSPDELAYISQHYIHLDHEQTYSASAGAAYQWGDTKFSGDMIFGSGLRSSLGLVPNGTALPDYTQVNLGAEQKFALPFAEGFKARFDIINVFDEKYEIRDGTGVGVGAPQYGPRRGFFVGLSKTF